MGYFKIVYLLLGPELHWVVCPVVVSPPLLDRVSLLLGREGGLGVRLAEGRPELRGDDALLCGLCNVKMSLMGQLSVINTHQYGCDRGCTDC